MQNKKIFLALLFLPLVQLTVACEKENKVSQKAQEWRAKVVEWANDFSSQAKEKVNKLSDSSWELLKKAEKAHGFYLKDGMWKETLYFNAVTGKCNEGVAKLQVFLQKLQKSENK